MTTASPSRVHATDELNNLRRGLTYCATTRSGMTIGEYVGIEVPYGDRAILLRHDTGTASIAMRDVTSICRVAA